MVEEKLCFTTDDGTKLELYVLEETRIGGTDYILVADSEEEDAQALILKDLSADGDFGLAMQCHVDCLHLDLAILLIISFRLFRRWQQHICL